MVGVLFMLLLVLPILELIVIIEVGQQIGVLPTIGLLIAISVAGTVLLKREGSAAWRRLQETLARGEIPTNEVVDGAMILFGGALLLTPGFISDVIGMLMILPPSRAVLRRGARKLVAFFTFRRLGVAADVGRRVYDARVTRVRQGPATPTSSSSDPLPAAERPPSAGDSRDTG